MLHRRAIVALLLVLLAIMCQRVHSAVTENCAQCEWRNVDPALVEVHEGALPQAHSLPDVRADGAPVWIKPFSAADTAALFREEDEASLRWSLWQPKLIRLRQVAAAASDKLSEDKERDDTAADTTVFFENVLDTLMSPEALQAREDERRSFLADGSVTNATVVLAREMDALRAALAPRQLVALDEATPSLSTNALFSVLLQSYFPDSFGFMRPAEHTGSSTFSSAPDPFGAVLRAFPIAFSAVANPPSFAVFAKERQSMGSALSQVSVKQNASKSDTVATRSFLFKDFDTMLTRSAGFLDTIDALARPLCPVALSAVEQELSLIQATLFDPDGRPRSHPQSAELKRQKGFLRRWRKMINTFCDSRPPGLTLRFQRLLVAESTPTSRSSTKRTRATALDAEAIAASLALVAKYRFGDPLARLAPPEGLPEALEGAMLGGLTVDEITEGVVPWVLFAAATSLVLSVGLFELQLMCLRRVKAERRAALEWHRRYGQTAGASLPASGSSFSHKVFTLASILLTFCPWLVAVTMLSVHLYSQPVPLSVLPHFLFRATGLRLMTCCLVVWLGVNWSITLSIRLYGKLVHTVDSFNAAKSKSD